MLKHWQCGGILCSVYPVPHLIKDAKAIVYSVVRRYSSGENEAEQ
jgi:hypothetical protein